MNVTLPDGTVLTDIPDATSKAELLAKLTANGYDVSKLGAEPEKAPSIGRNIAQGAGDLVAGAIRGAGSIGATLMAPKDMISDALDGKGLSLESNRQRRSDMDSALGSMGADTDSAMYSGGKMVGEIAGTAGIGGLIAKPLQAYAATRGATPALDAAIESLKTGGFKAGTLGWSTPKGALTHVMGGVINGAASAGGVDPHAAGFGAVLGGVIPGAGTVVGKGAGAVYGMAKNASSGGVQNSGKLLADALDLSVPDLRSVIAAAKLAPDSIVPGSDFTLAQALQKMGANQPSVKMLERIAAGGPGGDVLLRRFDGQGAASTSTRKL